MRLLHSSRLLALTTGSALLLAACQPEIPSPAPTPDTTPQQPTTSATATTTSVLSLESPATGEITSLSPVNRNDGSRYAVIPVRLSAGEATQITLEGPLRGKLSLFEGNKLLASSYAACCTPEDGPVRIVVQHPKGGDFELGVSGQDANSFGPFEIKASLSQVRSGGELKLDETLNGWFNPSEAGNRQMGHTYQFAVAEPGLYEFALRSKEFDAYLTLSGMGLNLEDDDSGGDNDARLIAQLEPGQYELKVAAYGGQGAGSYALSSGTPRPPAGIDLLLGGKLNLDTQVAGIITGQPLVYEFDLNERRRLVIDMQSNDIDSHLQLEGNGINLSDDDSGSGNNARINAVLEAGTYRLEARALGGNRGVFTLSTQSQAAPAPGGGPIQRGYAGEGYLNPGSPNHYQLTVEEPGTYVIYLGSSNFDAGLTISGNGVDVSDDDGGQGFDSRIEIQLQPGTYTITAGAISSDGGSYRLSVE